VVIENPPESSVVRIADALGFDHATRYAVQTKVGPIGDGAVIAVFHDEEEGPAGMRRPLFVAASVDGGATFSDAERLTGESFTHVGFAALATRDDTVVVAFTGRLEDMALNGIFVQQGTWDGVGMAWQEPQLATPADADVDYKFASVAIDSHGHRHVVCRADADYDPECDPDVEDCLQEQRQIVYLEDAAGDWSVTQISEQWTSTVPELVLDDDGGSDGAAGRGRLWATWHNEERLTVPIGCMVDDVSLWTVDLDGGDAELGRIPGTWEGEGCDAEIKSAALPSIAVDASGQLHALWCLADPDNDLDVRYARRLDDQETWSEPESISSRAIRYGAVLTLGDDDQPLAFAPRNGDESGEVVAFRRAGDGWSETVLDRSDEHGFNWVNPSASRLHDGRIGLVYGEETDEGAGGIVYFTAGP